MTAAVYVTGHGYGHAVRTAEVLREWLRLMPQLRIRVRTTASERLFAGLPVAVERAAIDSGMCETGGGLGIDAPATVAALEQVLASRDEIVAREAAAVCGAAVVVADVPWLAGEIAEALGIPCVGLGNFTWDWIYEPLTPNVGPIRDAYRKFGLFLRTPLCQPCWGVFPRIEDIPLLTRAHTRTREETLRALGIAPGDRRIRVVVGLRGGLPDAVLEEARRTAPDCAFLRPDSGVPFQDLLAAADVVVSKIGYGTVAECIAAGTRLLCPPRTGFREVEPAREQARPYLSMLEISRADFDAGRWSSAIHALAAIPVPPVRPPCDGAAHAARILTGILM